METTIGVDFYLSEINLDGKKIKVGNCSVLSETWLYQVSVLSGEDLGYSWLREVHVDICGLL